MNEVAKMLGVTPRTLQNWKTELRSQKTIGRPKVETTLSELLTIAREWKRQAYRGARPVSEALPWMRVRLIQEVISKLKMKRRSRESKRRELQRVSVISVQVGALHVLDGAQVKSKELLLVGKDRGSQMIIVKKLEDGFDAKKTIEYLDELEKSDGLPLVIATDNGSQFCAKEVTSYLEEKKIIHLRSLPRTPQHNGSCEIAVRELKETLQNANNLKKSVDALNKGLKRRQLGYKTAFEVDEQNRVRYSKEERQIFYEEAKKLCCSKIFGLKDARKVRKAEREAIMQTLERFKLIKLTRGSQSQIMKPENNA